MAESAESRPGAAEPGAHCAWKRWEFFAVIVPLLLFAGLAAYRIHEPGLYYDEMFVLSPATGTPAYQTWLGIPILISSYVGADKALVYLLIFKIFGASAWSIRLPAILMSCGTLILGYSLMRRILSPLWALAFTSACAVHPGFIFLTKVDWGPQVLMLFLKALCLLLWFRWLHGTQKSCWSVLGLWALGFWDKFNFIWFVVALLGATALIYRAVILRRLQSVRRSILVTLAVGVAGSALLAGWIIFPLLEKPDTGQFAARLSQIWTLYEWTVTGHATAYMWFKSIPPIPLWSGWFVLAVTFVCLLLVFLARAAKSGGETGTERRAFVFCLWSLLMFAIIFLEIAVTRQAGGAHHTIMLFPFDLFACFTAAFLLVKASPVRARSWIIFTQLILLFGWVTAEGQSLRGHFQSFAATDNFWGRWSPQIELLAKYLDVKGTQADAIYCVEWGVGTQLIALCRPDIGRKIRDDWPTFQNWSAQQGTAKATATSVFRPHQRALYVTFSKTDPVFQPAQEHFAQMAVLAGKPATLVPDVPAKIRQTYQVFEAGPGESE